MRYTVELEAYGSVSIIGNTYNKYAVRTLYEAYLKKHHLLMGKDTPTNVPNILRRYKTFHQGIFIGYIIVRCYND